MSRHFAGIAVAALEKFDDLIGLPARFEKRQQAAEILLFQERFDRCYELLGLDRICVHRVMLGSLNHAIPQKLRVLGSLRFVLSR